MASLKKEPRYTTVQPEDPDLENDSDTTLASEGLFKNSGRPEKKRTTRLRISRTQEMLSWVRWGVILALQCVIIVLLLSRGLSEGMKDSKVWTQADTETGGDINGLYIPQSHTYTLLTTEEKKYFPNMKSNENRMEIRHNWDMLMPLGSGSVLIPDYEQHPMLGKPIIDDPIREGPLFEASWTHALHCLYYSVDSYHQLVLSNGTRFGFEGDRNDAHAAHCFEYVRNQILCMADMTLEGSQSILGAKGDGQPHMCRNRDEAVAWIEERRMDDIQSIVGP